MIVPKLRAPIVLIHGLLGFGRLGVGNWVLADYFHGIPEALEKAGNRVLLPNLSLTGGIGDRARARPAELSGGELARAGLAVALANDPTVVLADEPTGELDHANALRIVELLRRGADHGGAVIVMTHSRAVASGADRVIALRDGQVVP